MSRHHMIFNTQHSTFSAMSTWTYKVSIKETSCINICMISAILVNLIFKVDYKDGMSLHKSRKLIIATKGCHFSF